MKPARAALSRLLLGALLFGTAVSTLAQAPPRSRNDIVKSLDLRGNEDEATQ
jgi:hypothetical protein